MIIVTRNPYIRLAVVAAIVVAAAALSYQVNPVGSTFSPKCPVHLLTGLDCPTCGLQRFFHNLLHGRLAAAVALNPFLLVALPYVVAFVVAWVLPTGSRAHTRLWRVIAHPAMVWTYVVAYLAWFVVRNIISV